MIADTMHICMGPLLEAYLTWAGERWGAQLRLLGQGLLDDRRCCLPLPQFRQQAHHLHVPLSLSAHYVLS